MTHSVKIWLLAALSLRALCACTEEPRNTEPLVDPWLRERTPVNFRLQSQIGAATITSDWRNDAEGTIFVTLISGSLDLSRVPVEALDFAYPESEYCPTASVKAGDTIDLSGGSARIVVTAYNGETRTYTVTYEPFVDAVEGVYKFVTHCCWLYGGNVAAWGGTHIMSFFDKDWNFPSSNYKWEDDNTLTLVCTGADPETGDTWGTVRNDAGADGKYASFDSNWGSLQHFYRCIPEGDGTYSTKASTGEITFKGTYTNAEGQQVELEKTCSIWPEGEYSPLAEIYADAIALGDGTDAPNVKKLTIPAGQCAFTFKFPRDYPGLTVLASSDYSDKDKFYNYPKFFFVLAEKQ